MVTKQTFRKLALAFPEASEQPHFEKTSFRVNKKIFATLSADKPIACIKLSEIDQSVFCAIDKTMIYRVDNKWGKQGWTLIDLSKITKTILKEVLMLSYNQMGTKKKRYMHDSS